MGWVRFDNGIGSGRKAAELSDEYFLPALGLLLVCVAYCDHHRTDGFIAARALCRIAFGDFENPLAELVRVGFIERTRGGYLIHNYLKWQQSAAKIEAHSEMQREKARCRWSAVGNAGGSADGDADKTRQDETIHMRTDRTGRSVAVDDSQNGASPSPNDIAELEAMAENRLTSEEAVLLARRYGKDVAFEAVRRTCAKMISGEPIQDFYRLADKIAQNVAADWTRQAD